MPASGVVKIASAGTPVAAAGARRRAGDRGAAAERLAAVGGAQDVAVAQEQVADLRVDEVRGRDPVRAVGLGQHEHLVERLAAVVGAAHDAAVAAEDHDHVRRDRLQAGEVLRRAGGEAGPGRAAVVGAQRGAVVADRVAAARDEVHRADRVALRRRVAPLPAGLADLHRGTGRRACGGQAQGSASAQKALVLTYFSSRCGLVLKRKRARCCGYGRETKSRALRSAWSPAKCCGRPPWASR